MRIISAIVLQPRRACGPTGSLVLALFGWLAWAAVPALADPITNATVVNVTPSGFSVFWRTGNSVPSIAVFADPGGVTNLAGQLGIEAFPLRTGNPTLTNAYDRRLDMAGTRQKSKSAGLNLLRVTGCTPGTTYYYQLTSTPAHGSPALYPSSGPLPGVTTEVENTFVINAQQLIMNVIGIDTEGYVVLLRHTNAPHPLAAVVGDGVAKNQVFFNVNDLFTLGGGGNFAGPGTQQFTAQVIGTNQTDQILQLSLNFTTQFVIAAVTQVGLTNEFVTLALGSTILLEGQTGSVPVSFNSSAAIASLNFLLNIPPGHLTNFTLLSIAPQIDVTSVSITPQSGSTSLVRVSTLPGQTLSGGQQVGLLGFQAVSNVPSAFVPLSLASVTAAKPDASPVSVLAAQSGRAVVIGAQPLLENHLGALGQRSLTLYGRPWSAYQIQYATNLSAPVWQPVSRVALTNLVASLSGAGPTASSVFFRAVEFAPDPPVLDALRSIASARQLLGYGRSGSNYTVFAATNLSAPTVWVPIDTYTLTNSFHYISVPGSNAVIFYRLGRN